MRRVNVALFLITVAIVVFSLFRSVLGGPAGPAEAFARRSPTARPAQTLLAAQDRHLSVDCSLAPDFIGSTISNQRVVGSKLPAKASTYPED